MRSYIETEMLIELNPEIFAETISTCVVRIYHDAIAMIYPNGEEQTNLVLKGNDPEQAITINEPYEQFKTRFDLTPQFKFFTN